MPSEAEWLLRTSSDRNSLATIEDFTTRRRVRMDLDTVQYKFDKLIIDRVVLKERVAQVTMDRLIARHSGHGDLGTRR